MYKNIYGQRALKQIKISLCIKKVNSQNIFGGLDGSSWWDFFFYFQFTKMFNEHCFHNGNINLTLNIKKNMVNFELSMKQQLV